MLNLIEGGRRHQRFALSFVVAAFLGVAAAGSAYSLGSKDTDADVMQGAGQYTLYFPHIEKGATIIPTAKPFPNIPEIPHPPENVYAGCTVSETESIKRGWIGWEVTRRIITNYNEKSLPVHISYDDHGDGSVEQETDNTYGQYGLTSSIIKRMPDDRIIATQSNFFDSAGKWTQSTVDDNGDGRTDLTVRAAYDRDGYRIKTIEDFTDNGISDEVIVFAWDSNGQLIEERKDLTGDGQPDFIYTHTWQNGLPIQTDIHVTSDSSRDDSRQYIYDVDGRLIEVQWTFRTLGQAIGKSIYSYGANGFVNENTNFGTDGSFWDTTHYIYGDNNRLTQEASGTVYKEEHNYVNSCP